MTVSRITEGRHDCKSDILGKCDYQYLREVVTISWISEGSCDYNLDI